MKNLLKNLEIDYPEIVFKRDSFFYWSPSEKAVYYDENLTSIKKNWSLLHEVSHAVLNHKKYFSDFELIKLESDAWEHAITLAKKYGLTIDQEHIQDCLDTYRDWLHGRSTCPTCNNVSPQKDSQTYECFNCKTVWTVSNSRFCKPYRRVKV